MPIRRPRSRRFVAPRKEKVWARSILQIDVSGIAGPVVSPMLEDFRTAVGINDLQKVTVMRMVGEVKLVEQNTASSSAYQELAVGIAWLPDRISDEAAGSTEIPLPSNYQREALWLTKFLIGGQETAGASAQAGRPCDPPEMSIRHLDVTQKRKQQVGTDKLCIVWQRTTSAGTESGVTDLRVDLDVLLALA